MTELIEGLRVWIESIILWMGYGGIAIVMFLETVFPPIPSEMVMPFAGFIAADGRLNFPLVIVAGTVGAIAGAWLLYWIGARVSESRLRDFINRYGRFALVSEADLDKSIDFFNKRGEWVIFFGRLIMLVRSLISIPAGMLRMSIPKFTFFTALGTGLWNVGLGAIGFLLGENWHSVIEVIDYWEEVILLVLAAAVIGVIYGRKLLVERKARMSK